MSLVRTALSAWLPRGLAALGIALSAGAWGQASHPCGPLENNYGPYDYRGREGSKRLVENAHFTYGVETLTQKMTGPFGGDIAYTLRAFPNHHRALLAMERLAQKEKADPPDGSRYPVECWYERALRFVPDDHIARLLYANFLLKRERREEAVKNIDYVAETTRDNPLAQLNVGRMYLDMQDYDKALIQAHRLIEMGFDRPDLKDRLVAAGRWVEPGAAAEAAASAASGAASAPTSPPPPASAASAGTP